MTALPSYAAERAVEVAAVAPAGFANCCRGNAVLKASTASDMAPRKTAASKPGPMSTFQTLLSAERDYRRGARVRTSRDVTHCSIARGRGSRRHRTRWTAGPRSAGRSPPRLPCPTALGSGRTGVLRLRQVARRRPRVVERHPPRRRGPGTFRSCAARRHSSCTRTVTTTTSWRSGVLRRPAAVKGAGREAQARFAQRIQPRR
jgi:hypothetical protein